MKPTNTNDLNTVERQKWFGCFVCVCEREREERKKEREKVEKGKMRERREKESARERK